MRISSVDSMINRVKQDIMRRVDTRVEEKVEETVDKSLNKKADEDGYFIHRTLNGYSNSIENLIYVAS